MEKVSQDPKATVESGLLATGFNPVQYKHRSLQLILTNATNIDLLLTQNYFDSGRWFQSFPDTIKAGQAVTGFVANKDGSVLTGVTGGLGLRVDGSNVCLGLGFSNPQTGTYKTSVVFSSDNVNPGKEAYEVLDNNQYKSIYREGFQLQAAQFSSQKAMAGFAYTFKKA